MAILTNAKLLSAKELAGELGRSIRYVRKMKQRGFKMVAGRATLESAVAWLDTNPPPCAD
jgi:hypothetical protein